MSSYLFRMRVKGYAHVEQVSTLLHAGEEGVHALLQEPRLPVDLLGVAFSRLGQFICCG